jgi:hypothetical protein
VLNDGSGEWDKGSADIPCLRHTHRARARATAPLPTPAREVGTIDGTGRQRDVGPLVKSRTNRNTCTVTGKPRRTGGHCATARPVLAHRQRELLEREDGPDIARLRHTHRARARATAPLPTPAREVGTIGGTGRQRDVGPLVKSRTNRNTCTVTGKPRRTGDYCATARPVLAHRQRELC